MSRGPGRWQRAILTAVETITPEQVVGLTYIVRDEVGETPTRAEMVAARRAVKRLVEDGHIRAGWFWGSDPNGRRVQVLGIMTPDSVVSPTYHGTERTGLPEWHTPRTSWPTPTG